MTHKIRKNTFLVLITLDPDPQLEKNVGSGSVPGSALNQCGSTTLPWPKPTSFKIPFLSDDP
jgi:hypothetical protein